MTKDELNKIKPFIRHAYINGVLSTQSDIIKQKYYDDILFRFEEYWNGISNLLTDK